MTLLYITEAILWKPFKIPSLLASSGWRKSDTVWMLGLYGTAIGAGVLFLPINAGVGGLIPLIIMAILAFPMTFLPTAV